MRLDRTYDTFRSHSFIRIYPLYSDLRIVKLISQETSKYSYYNNILSNKLELCFGRGQMSSFGIAFKIYYMLNYLLLFTLRRDNFKLTVH